MKRWVFSSLSILLLSYTLPAFAVPKEAPPMEPPYTNDTEFDPLLNEDPSATSNSTIPTSPNIEQPGAQKPASPEQQSTNKPTTPGAVTSEDAGSPPSRTESASERPRRKSRKGVRMIEHPDAKKGLVRIEQNGTYVYKVKMGSAQNTGTLRFGQMEAPNIVSADGKTDFATMYDTDALPMIMMDYDWQPFSRFGKLGVQLGIGFATATGQGRFLNGNPDKAEEVYTFIAIPVNLGLIYRFQYARGQWLAPYASGGGSYIGIAELRDDNKSNFTGTPAAYAAGGLMFNVAAFDNDVAFTLDNEYGVHGLWVTAEYRYMYAFSEDLDFGGSIISLGVSAEF